MPKYIHLLIPDLFLPQEVAGEACAGLSLPALEWLLARAQPHSLAENTLEAWLCDAFGVSNQAIAPITLLADGILPGNRYWLRADPVHIQMQREQMILQSDVVLDAGEAAQLCASLNAHFAVEGLHFFAPHPQRWYLQLDNIPDMTTRTLAQVVGRNLRAHLPQGPDALRWHRVFNEIQMLFFEHAVNLAREARGAQPINSVWLWGGGSATQELAKNFTQVTPAWVAGDSSLAAAFALAAGIPHTALPDDLSWFSKENGGDALIVCEGLRRALQQHDLTAWRSAVLNLERTCMMPLRDALRAGHITQLTLDVSGASAACRFTLTRSASWKLWRLSKSLARYSHVYT